MANKTSKKLTARLRRKRRVRGKIFGTAERPRLSVFRSSKHIYAQVIDDRTGVTLATASTLDKALDLAGKDKKEGALAVGTLLAERCKENGITTIVFDRNGYPYNSGRVLNLAKGARDGGLIF